MVLERQYEWIETERRWRLGSVISQWIDMTTQAKSVYPSLSTTTRYVWFP